MPSDVPDERLRDIVANIDRLDKHLQGTQPGAPLDHKTRDAVERCLERISEAAKKLGEVMETRQPQIPWRSIRGIGNVLRHEYDAVDDLTIENVVTQHLGALRAACVDELALLEAQKRLL